MIRIQRLCAWKQALDPGQLSQYQYNYEHFDTAKGNIKALPLDRGVSRKNEMPMDRLSKEGP